MKKLHFKQRMLRWTKKQKKKAPLHTAVAFFLTLGVLVSVPFLSGEDEVSAGTGGTGNPKEVLSMTMVGDMMMGRHVGKVVQRSGYDSLFDGVRSHLRSSDLVTGNFNQPLLLQDPEQYPKLQDKILLHTGPGAAKALKKAGFTSVNLANTHMMDYGGPGMADTQKALRDADLPGVGAGRDRYDAERIVYQDVNGIRVATLGMTDVVEKGTSVRQNRPGVRSANLKSVLPLVRSAEKNADLVVVHIHWGVEYDSNVHPRQRAIGRALADAGADIVVGHHPHVLEPVEFYKGAMILYSTGNFISDQGWSRTKESALFQYRLFKDGRAWLEIHPLLIREGRPRLLDGGWGAYRRERVYLQVTDQPLFSEAFKRMWKRKGNRLVHEMDHSRILKARAGKEGGNR
ncbi:poly-gamma-glutamate synthesis protein (capsule biosynthesis protein) [Melghirimyces profundicolus]|uniref:Poly-gamma-glutamate synthesis protein (Capsule biosynthesis protein) n=1 Tax=Melghirimyces profundicolus TaxID=1242148 RepID=A0A2T6BTK0_9BACL|nr:CapA family protein [Melghirimyces profundicolus]PTX59410.1 poly-gamma-glutamate synthesis protein (capsule biosynthesis protein) [Melghirimyces profundicolus]